MFFAQGVTVGLGYQKAFSLLIAVILVEKSFHFFCYQT